MYLIVHCVNFIAEAALKAGGDQVEIKGWAGLGNEKLCVNVTE